MARTAPKPEIAILPRRLSRLQPAVFKRLYPELEDLHGLSVQTVAREVGMSLERCYRVLTGVVRPKPEELVTLSKELGIGMERLVEAATVYHSKSAQQRTLEYRRQYYKAKKAREANTKVSITKLVYRGAGEVE